MSLDFSHTWNCFGWHIIQLTICCLGCACYVSVPDYLESDDAQSLYEPAGPPRTNTFIDFNIKYMWSYLLAFVENSCWAALSHAKVIINKQQPHS